MPIYIFHCEEHGDFDEIVPFGTEAAKCPKCPQCEFTPLCKREGIEVPAKRNPAYGIQG